MWDETVMGEGRGLRDDKDRGSEKGHDGRSRDGVTSASMGSQKPQERRLWKRVLGQVTGNMVLAPMAVLSTGLELRGGRLQRSGEGSPGSGQRGAAARFPGSVGGFLLPGTDFPPHIPMCPRHPYAWHFLGKALGKCISPPLSVSLHLFTFLVEL